MCTIGAVFADGGVYTFKQCDLTKPTKFYDPETRQGKFPYKAFYRDGRPGIWAGINKAGVAFTAADAYTNADYPATDDDVNALFKVYELSVSSCITARDAANILQNFYRNYVSAKGVKGFPAPDIALHSDRGNIIFTEYTPALYNQNPVRELVVTRGFFTSTNHFRIQFDAVEYEKNHSTYLRLGRATLTLENDQSKNGIYSLLTDGYYGKTELSICRFAQYSGEYYTQATALLVNLPGLVACEYQINNNPKDNPLKKCTSPLVGSLSKKPAGAGKSKRRTK